MRVWWLWFVAVNVVMTGSAISAPQQSEPLAESPGKGIYDYFCYQCHGYNGDSKTLASSYLSPVPRDFTRSDPGKLSRDKMIQAVTHGKPGTAMSSFSRVLDGEQITQVVDFIRQTFLAKPVLGRRYHTEANGWPSHQRYAKAFPFAQGDIPLDRSWDVLTAEQREGKRLYLESCVSCHDHANTGTEQAIWSPRAVSYPRQYYIFEHEAHEEEHHTDGHHAESDYDELAFELHETAPQVADLTPRERHGERIYQANCAFCHAEDGTGLNWIGSFLEPHPPDLNLRMAVLSTQELRHIIWNGISGTSMPAWRGAFDKEQLTAVIAYMQRVFKESGTNIEAVSSKAVSLPLQWQR